ncbi:MAG: TRAM domain-containing protein [Spirochaetia bacterium]|nr:TRAM domain-containing protein [Spirochaetia bacterium]
MLTHNIITEKMTFGGDCIAKIDGKTIFIPFAVPGEKLKIQITEEKRDYCRAKIVEIINPSPHRIKPVCPLYEKCGGCNLMHIDYEFQKELKKEILKDLFIKNSVTPPEITVISGDAFSYRNRFQLTDGSLSEKNSNTKVDFSFCPVAVKEINDYLKNTPQINRPKGRCNIFAGENLTENPFTHKKIYIAEPKTVNQEQNFYPKNKRIKQIKKRYTGPVFSPENAAEVTINEKKISFDVRGFFQSNLQVLSKSIEKVTDFLSGENVLDMYAGCGTFSVFLKDKFEKITLVEHNRDALLFAEQNLSGKNHISFGLSGEKWAQEQKNSNFDAVVIDPPRSGIEKGVMEFLKKSEIPVIRSVSCDPATHARDAKQLTESGRTLEKLFLLDFYPQTSHIESLAWFLK